MPIQNKPQKSTKRSTCFECTKQTACAIMKSAYGAVDFEFCYKAELCSITILTLQHS